MNTNWIDPKIPGDLKKTAELIINELQLQNAYLRVRYNEKLKQLSFTQDRRVVEVPLVLFDENKWSDIRFLFRSILTSPPSTWNRTADTNDWSAYKKHFYNEK